MRHAFLVVAHNNWWQLRQLISALDAENHDLFIHVDKKRKDFNKADFLYAAKKSKVNFYQTYMVYWGGVLSSTSRDAFARKSI